jgi:hypothetical protein
MPFFYSQYLKDDKKAWAVREVSHQVPGSRNSPPSSIKHNNTTKNQQVAVAASEQKQKQPSAAAIAPSRPVEPSRLVWHSNVGSTKRSPSNHVNKRGGFFSAFQYNNPFKKKTVHFATIEVQPYHVDYSCDKDVYYRKDEIAAMNKQRFTDASELRNQRNVADPKDDDKHHALDDAYIAKRTADIDKLLSEAFNAETDVDEQVSIRGIEHFVYPQLQQEMIRRKKQAKREVINFKKSKRPDPQGWKLARLSEQYTQWAREVALEKGMKYCMNQEAIYGSQNCGISKDELERSKDELDNLHMLKTSASFAMNTWATSSESASSSSYRRHSELEIVANKSEVSDVTALMSNVTTSVVLQQQQEEQAAGVDTRED